MWWKGRRRANPTQSLLARKFEEDSERTTQRTTKTLPHKNKEEEGKQNDADGEVNIEVEKPEEGGLDVDELDDVEDPQS